MAKDGDIVFMIGADASGLTKAGQSAGQSLAKMEKDAKALERQLDKIGSAGVAFQRKMNDLTGVTRAFSKSARDSANAFEAFDRSRAQVDALRASIDPLFAASKRYEEALRQLDTALEQGAISAREHAKMTDLVAASMLRADGATSAMGGGFMGLGNMSNATKGKIQQFGFQVQDVAVQLAAGTRATTVFAQQGSQILSIFGPMGAMLGVVAAVGLPLLGAAFAAAGGDAKSFEDSIEGVKKSTSELKAITDIYSMEGLAQLKAKYGEVNAEVLRLLDSQRQQALFTLEQDAAASITTLVEQYGLLAINLDAVGRAAQQSQIVLGQLASELGLTVPQARALVAAFQELERAPLADKPRILSQIRTMLQGAKGDTSQWVAAINMAEDALRQANAEGARAGGWIATAIAGTQTWAAAMWDVARAAAAARQWENQTKGNADWAKNQFGITLPGNELLGMPQDASGSGGGGGGGGGGSSQAETELEALRAQFLTAEEVELAHFEKRQQMLEDALSQRKITQDEYQRLMEQSNQDHAAKMAEIDVWRYGSVLDKTEAFMGGMAQILQAGGEKQQRIAAIFSAAQALISTYQGAAKELEKGTLGFGSAMAVIAKGMGFVAAIRSAGKGSGGSAGGGARGGTSASASASAAPPVQRVLIDYNGPQSAFGSFSTLVDMMNKAGKAGYVLNAEITGRS